MRLPLIAVAALLANTVLAIFSDEAWNIDYHFALLGEPQEQTTFFHQPNPSSKASLLYTHSDKGIVGAVNPRDGSLVWRQKLQQSARRSNASFLRAGDGQDTVISASTDQIWAWSAADGRLAWNLDIADGPVKDVEILALSDGRDGAVAKDALVLSGEDEGLVQRLDGNTGATKWQHRLSSGDIPYQVSASTTEVFAVLLHKTMLGYIKIKVISLDPVTGRKTDEYTLSSESELLSPKTIISVGANSASPIIAWTDQAHSVLKVNIIGTKAVASFDIDKHNGHAVEKVMLHAPYQTTSLSHFLVHYETAISHWGEVYHIDLKSNSIEKAYSLPKINGGGAFSTSTSDANVYFTRITENQIVVVSSVSHGVLGRWPIDSFGVPFVKGKISPVHAVSEVSIKAGTVSALRTAVLLSSGEWILLRDGAAVWQRPEGLADTVSATFVTSENQENIVQELELEAHSNPVQAYVHRVKRHSEDLHHLPAFLRSLPQRFLAGLFGLSTDGGAASDTFGYHKTVICATAKGWLVALDTGSSGRQLWSVQAATLQPGHSWMPHLEARADSVLVTTAESNHHEVQVFSASHGEKLQAPPPKVAQEPALSTATTIQYSVTGGKLEASKDGKASWHFLPVAGERIVDLTVRPVDDPVASIGKVLGDRNVLYKYLDPNLALLTTMNDLSKSASFYVLDTVSGAVLHSNSHDDIDMAASVSAIVSENWFAYSFTAGPSDAAPKGHQLVVGELLESLVPNDRGPLSAATNYSSMQAGAQPYTLTQTYQIPEPISKMAVTQTRQGITSRQLLIVLEQSESIVGLPRSVIDPRRPIGRDPTSNEQAEGLMRYQPVIEFDPKWYLNHQREVLGTQEVITSPALLESTSLVFAYGLDVFGTRLSPSFSFDVLGKDFNKFQMLATVAALAVATLLVAPLVMRKQVNARWQFA